MGGHGSLLGGWNRTGGILEGQKAAELPTEPHLWQDDGDLAQESGPS